MKILVKILPLLLLLSLVNISHIQANEPIDKAKAHLDQSFNIILNLIKDPKFDIDASRPDILKKIEIEIKQLFDFNEFSARAAGKAWDQFTVAQKDEFSNAFANLLIYTYLSKIRNYNGEKISYTNSRSSKSGNRVEISTIIDLNNGKKIPVAYRMLVKNQTWFVYDVIVERLSLVNNFRVQFHDTFTKNGAEALIEIIKTKAAEVQASQE